MFELAILAAQLAQLRGLRRGQAGAVAVLDVGDRDGVLRLVVERDDIDLINDHVEAAGLAMLACGFRVSGLFLVGGLGLLALTQRDVGWPRRLAHAAIAALGVLGVVAYFAHLHQLTGSWTAWFDAQAAGWNRGFFGPLESLRNTLDAGDPAKWPDRPSVAWVFRAEVVSMLVGGDVLQSWTFDIPVPLLGKVHLVTSVFFDIGVYLVVIGLMLDILRSLGSALDHDPGRPVPFMRGGGTVGSVDSRKWVHR